jgi:hypothetical protein
VTLATLAVVVPTRGRPQNAARLINQWEVTGADSQLIFRVDEDDPELDGYRALNLTPWGEPVAMVVGESLRMGGALNELGRIVAQAVDVLGFMGDDHLPHGAQWDRIIRRAFSWSGGEPLVIYGNDLIQGPELPTAVFLDARIVRTLGYVVPPGLIHLFMDNYWKWLGTHLGTITYMPNLIIEHLHPLVGKAPHDERYAAVNADDVWQHDERVFEEWVLRHSATAVDAILKACT